jgi:hypothetical protein
MAKHELIKVERAAKLIGVTPDAVRIAAQQGKLSRFRSKARRVLLREVEVREFAAARRAKLRARRRLRARVRALILAGHPTRAIVARTGLTRKQVLNYRRDRSKR